MTNGFETKMLSLLFNNSAAGNVGDAAGLPASVGAGSFYVSLHTAALADTDAVQTASECDYTGPYARVAVPRSAGGWTVAGSTVDNTALITFPAATSSENVTDFGIGFAASGAGELQFYGTSALAVSNGITPQFAIGALNITLD